MRHTRKCSFLLAVLALGAPACYPDRIENTSDLDTVTTVFDKTADFGAAKRYAVPDSIVALAGSGETVPVITQSFKSSVISAIRQNMNQAGYVEEPNPAANPPDVVVVASVTTTQNIGYVVSGWWGYYGWYPGWGYPYYGSSWGWSYPPGYSYSYTTGTLITTMVDNRHNNPQTQQVPVIWVSAVNGVVSGNQTTRAVNGVNQAFKQSPYLKAQ